jgi:hypothetical protein
MRIFIEGTMLIYEAKMQCNILNKYLPMLQVFDVRQNICLPYIERSN